MSKSSSQSSLTSSEDYESCVSSESEEFHSLEEPLHHEHIYADVIVSTQSETSSIDSVPGCTILQETLSVEKSEDPEIQQEYNHPTTPNMEDELSTVGDFDDINIDRNNSLKDKPNLAGGFLEQIGYQRYRIRYAMPTLYSEETAATVGQPIEPPRSNPVFPDNCSQVIAAFCVIVVLVIFIYYLCVLDIGN